MSGDQDITWNWPDNAYGPIQRAATFSSRILGTDYGFGIYLPPSYVSSPDRHYKVLYWLHGYTSRPHYAGYLVERLHRAIGLAEAPEMIVVAVNGLYTAMFCDDASGKRPVESVIMQELIPYVDTTYRTTPTRDGRAIEGFSRGGFGAAHLAFRHPDTFGCLSMMAGAFHSAEGLPRDRPQLFQDYVGGDQARWNEANAWDLASAAADTLRGQLPMRMVVGGADAGQYTGNLAFHAHLRALGLQCPLTVIPGVDHSIRQLYDNYPGNPFGFFEGWAHN